MKRFQNSTKGILYLLLCVVFCGCGIEIEQSVNKIKNKPRYFITTYVWDGRDDLYHSYAITVFDSLKTVTYKERRKSEIFLENYKLSIKH